MIGAFTDGRLRWTALTGSVARRSMSAALASNVRPGFPATVRSMRPAPTSNGSVGVVRSSLTTSVIAVVISADLIWPGVHVGCSALSRTAEPAECGDDIEVPAIAWK